MKGPDFALDNSLSSTHGGLGRATNLAYYVYTGFAELKPMEQSAAANIMHSFDISTWALLAMSLIFITITLYFMYNKENEATIY